MSQPGREAELYEASEAFWDGETQLMRNAILLTGDYRTEAAALLAKVSFKSLGKYTQRFVVRQIGDSLVE